MFKKRALETTCLRMSAVSKAAWGEPMICLHQNKTLFGHLAESPSVEEPRTVSGAWQLDFTRLYVWKRELLRVT